MRNGVIIMLICLWGGSWVGSKLVDTWMIIPVIVTFFIGFVAGLVLFIFSAADAYDRRDY